MVVRFDKEYMFTVFLYLVEGRYGLGYLSSSNILALPSERVPNPVHEEHVSVLVLLKEIPW